MHLNPFAKKYIKGFNLSMKFKNNKYLKVRIFLLAIIVLCVGCDNSSKDKLSINEDKALDSILTLYGGYVSLSKGLSIKNGKKTSYAELKLENSITVEDYVNFNYLPASNIATIFFSIADRDYEKYKVDVHYENGIRKFEYTKERLTNVLKGIELSKKIVNDLKNRNYNDLNNSLADSDVFDFDIQKLSNSMKKIDTINGVILDEIYTGFTYNTTDTGLNFIKIYGVLKRQDKDNLFSIYYEPTRDSILYIDYKW